MDGKHNIVMISILCLTILEACAILTGTDGAYFLPIVAAIAGLGGYELRTVRDKIGKIN